jgi:DNA-binding NarL/FixJ family response regulator
MRVVIADDSALLREGLARLLKEAGITVCALARDAAELIEATTQHKPDTILVDIRMPPTFTHEGALAATTLRNAYPELGILLLSQSVESRYVAELAREHPRHFGYLLKDRVVNVTVLLDAIHQVAAGGTVLDPDVVAHLLGRSSVAAALGRLTTREREVIALMAQGRSNRTIGRMLVIDDKTVESHVASIFTKLDLPPTAEGHRRVLAALAWLST